MQNALLKFHLRNYNYFTVWYVDQLQLPSEKPYLLNALNHDTSNG